MLDTKDFLKALNGELNARILEAAEPLIQKALEDIEARMREQLVSSLIGMMQTNYTMDRMGESLHITVGVRKP